VGHHRQRASSCLSLFPGDRFCGFENVVGDIQGRSHQKSPDALDRRHSAGSHLRGGQGWNGGNVDAPTGPPQIVRGLHPVIEAAVVAKQLAQSNGDLGGDRLALL
jgi:hypothetical protein